MPIVGKEKTCHPTKKISLISNPWFLFKKNCHQVPNFAHLGSYLTLEFNNRKDKKGKKKPGELINDQSGTYPASNWFFFFLKVLKIIILRVFCGKKQRNTGFLF